MFKPLVGMTTKYLALLLMAGANPLFLYLPYSVSQTLANSV
jgi:hypothetical protein